MWILVAEALLALALLLFIVWWTLGSTQKREREEMRLRAEAAARTAAGRPSSTHRSELHDDT